MKKAMLTFVAALTVAAPAFAQTTTAPSSTSGSTLNPTVQSPSGNGGSSGVSGSSIGSPNSTYPGRLQDYSNPTVTSRPAIQNPGLQRK